MGLLKLDYDCSKKDMMSLLYKGLVSMRRVHDSKMSCPIIVKAMYAARTTHGYHIKLSYCDNILLYDATMQKIIEPDIRNYILHLQSLFGSDRTRGFFDARRVYHKEKIFNMLFDYKNGQQFSEDKQTKNEVNKLIRDVLK